MSWPVNPAWLNLSSLYREYISAKEAPNEVSRYHHLTAALYFGIAAIEAFLNGRMREHMSESFTPEAIMKALRNTKILDKIKKWPQEILGAPTALSPRTLDLLKLFNDVRGDVTHPKTPSRDIYERIEQIDPEDIFLSVAEYIVRFFEAKGAVFPYWLVGWNYLNPKQGAHEIIEIHEQQFCFSMEYLGARLHERFPHAPMLCARWWESEHQRTCGHVSRESIQKAR